MYLNLTTQTWSTDGGNFCNLIELYLLLHTNTHTHGTHIPLYVQNWHVSPSCVFSSWCVIDSLWTALHINTFSPRCCGDVLFTPVHVHYSLPVQEGSDVGSTITVWPQTAHCFQLFFCQLSPRCDDGMFLTYCWPRRYSSVLDAGLYSILCSYYKHCRLHLQSCSFPKRAYIVPIMKQYIVRCVNISLLATGV